MHSSKYTAENAISDKNRNIWEQYRPVNSINFSDLIEDKTIYDRTDGYIDNTFDSSEYGNEVDINPDALSVDDILGNSIVHEIRHLSQSRHGQLSTSIRASIPNRFYNSDENIGNITSEQLENESFRPAEEMLDQISKDEKDWEKSRADLPFTECDSISQPKSLAPHKLISKLHGKLTNMSDFSGYLVDGASCNDLSIGRYFSNRCEDLQDIIPNKSPTKKHEPISLFSNQFQQFDTKEPKKSLAKASTTTYNEDNNEESMHNSVISLSTIASHLDETDTDSPRTFLNKLYSKRNQALIKENVQLLQDTANQMKVNRHESVRREQSQKERDERFLSMMNSTKIDEKENLRQNSTMETESLESEASFSNKTLGSGYSPIKNGTNKLNDGNQYKNKRSHSSISSTYPDAIKQSPPTKNQISQHGENGETMTEKLASRYVSAMEQAPLDDISNSLQNQYSCSSMKSHRTNEAGAIRHCATDLGSIESQRHYGQNRSSDGMKMSLPAYGLHGIRNYYPDAITVDKRCNSQCSTHSEFTHSDGKFPLKASTSELVWECVKLRKSVTKSLVIKNTSDKKLSLKIDVSGPGFQIASSGATDSLVLHGHECRTMNFTFCPTIIGKAIGKVVFRPIKGWPEEIERSVYLWAYGGSTVLQLQGIERGPVGCSFLKMGETSSLKSTTLERTFNIYNKGPLNGVATIFVKPKTNQCISENHITIEPNKCVIRPDGVATIKVMYKLRRRDFERLKEKSCEVLTVGTLEVIFGSEPNRQRIASILMRNGNIPSTYKQLEFLVNNFPVAKMEDFTEYRERIDNVSDLFGCFRTSEIALTLNRTNLDETQNVDLSCCDDSVFFQTLCETPNQQTKSQSIHNLPQPKNDLMWSVHPKTLTMDSRNNSRKFITIQSFFNHVQTFQIDSNIGSYFNFSTRSGKIGPNSEFKIFIELKKNLHIPPLNGMVTIYIESGSIDIPINVQPIPYTYI